MIVVQIHVMLHVEETDSSGHHCSCGRTQAKHSYVHLLAVFDDQLRNGENKEDMENEEEDEEH